MCVCVKKADGYIGAHQLRPVVKCGRAILIEQGTVVVTVRPVAPDVPRHCKTVAAGRPLVLG